MKKGCLFLMMFFLLVLSGCWDFKELSEITIVTGMAIDKGKDAKYKVSLEAVNATELNPKTAGDSTASVIFSIEGEEIAEIIRQMNKGFTRHLIYSHLRAVIVSEEVARQGITELIDFMQRNREFRNDFNIIISRESDAEKILAVAYPFQKVSSLKINQQLETIREEWGGDPGVRLQDMIQSLISTGREPVAQSVKIRGKPEKGNSTQNMSKLKLDAMIVTSSIAVFKDDKLESYLDLEDVRDYLLINDRLKRTTYTVPCSEKKHFALRVYNSRTKVRTKYKGDIPHIYIEPIVESYIDGMGCPDNLDNVKTYQKFDKMATKFLENKIEETVKKAQEMEADIFGFGEKMFIYDNKRYKKVEKKWNEEFAKAQVHVDARVKIRRSGIDKAIFIEKQK